MDQNTFVKEMSKKAIRVFHEIDGILPSVAIAQSILESGYGTSELSKYNNVHGLNNYHDGYLVDDAGSVFLEVPQFHNGVTTYSTEEMATFKNFEDSFRSLKKWYTRPKYLHAKTYKHPEAQIKEIIKQGYATGQGYVDSICRLITQWNLTFYDKTYAIQLGSFKKLNYANDLKNEAQEYFKRFSIDTRVRNWYQDGNYMVLVELTHDYNRLTDSLLSACRRISAGAFKKEV